MSKEAGKSKIRSFVAMHGKPIAYSLIVVNSTPSLFCEAKKGMRGTDTFRCIVRSELKESSIIGAFNRNGKMIRTTLSGNDEVPNRGTMAFVGFSGIEDGENVEKWRRDLMDESFLALLFKVPGIELPVQVNLMILETKSPYEVKVTLPSEIFANIGDTFSCRVKVLGMHRVLVQAKPFEFVDYAGKRDLGGLRWVGVIRKEANEENGYECEWTCKVLAYGVYQLKGLGIWGIGDSNVTDVEVSQMVVVKPVVK
jgi:hypothetical protein